MSATKGKTYIDTIQSYLNPRIYMFLNLGNLLSEYNVIDYSTSVYPNPSNNVISINNSNFIIDNINLYSVSGKLVKSQKVNL